MTLKPINPLEYITDRDPVPESVLDVKSWFKTETLELTFGEYVGRPNEFVDLHKSDLIYYLGNGWYVDSVLSRGSDGKWTTTAYANAVQSGSAASQNDAHAYSANLSQSVATEDGGSMNTSINGNVGFRNEQKGFTVNMSGSGSAGGSATSGTASGDSRSNASSNTRGTSSTATEQEGGPYWAAWSKIRLKRRRMQSEAVLKDMITSFTKAYNEGRQINDERYDELVALYAIMLSRTEDEANAFAGLSVEDFKPLSDMIIAAVRDALEKYRGAVGDIPDEWMKSRIDEINRKFDALLSQKRSEAISNATYNTTIWTTTESGIERDRQIALNELKDTMVTLKIEAYGKIATITGDIGQKLLDCEIRIIEAQQKMLLGPTEVRNTVFKWMLDFMERRDDDYPGLDQLVTISDKLGYADGGMVAPTS